VISVTLDGATVPELTAPPAVPLRALVARNLHRLRADGSAGLDEIARAAADTGLDWTAAWLGGVERGTRSLTAEQLLALPVVLTAALGTRVTLADLLAGEAPVSLTPDERAAIPARYLRDLVTGLPLGAPFTAPVVATAPHIDVAARAAQKLREIRRAGPRRAPARPRRGWPASSASRRSG